MRGNSDSVVTIDGVSKRRILLVEDEPAIAEPLADALRRDGFVLTVVGTAAEALETHTRERFDVVLLDLMLPDRDGREVAREIRGSSDVPIIMVTARGEEIDRVVGLELGADDYVVKPFSAKELAARIRAVLRRGRAVRHRAEPIEVGDVTVDPGRRIATKREKALDLAAREFDLLHMLVRHAGEVVRRQDIMDEVWDPHWFGSTKTLDVHVSWLRKKLEDDPATPRYITTVRGVGFRFAAPEELERA